MRKMIFAKFYETENLTDMKFAGNPNYSVITEGNMALVRHASGYRGEEMKEHEPEFYATRGMIYDFTTGELLASGVRTPQPPGATIDGDFTFCYNTPEGVMFRMYFHNDVWHCSTNGRINPFNTQFGKLFTQLEQELSIDTSQLDTDCCYYVVMTHPSIQRMVDCASPALLLVDIYNRKTGKFAEKLAPIAGFTLPEGYREFPASVEAAAGAGADADASSAPIGSDEFWRELVSASSNGVTISCPDEKLYRFTDERHVLMAETWGNCSSRDEKYLSLYFAKMRKDGDDAVVKFTTVFPNQVSALDAYLKVIARFIKHVYNQYCSRMGLFTGKPQFTLHMRPLRPLFEVLVSKYDQIHAVAEYNEVIAEMAAFKIYKMAAMIAYFREYEYLYVCYDKTYDSYMTDNPGDKDFIAFTNNLDQFLIHVQDEYENRFRFRRYTEHIQSHKKLFARMNTVNHEAEFVSQDQIVDAMKTFTDEQVITMLYDYAVSR